MDITFLGAARTVTGSSYLVHHGGKNMLVDCGMYQGKRELTRRNYLGFAYKPSDIDAVILTHAHIDHSGLIPRLCMLGFRGPVYTTGATLDLCSIMFQDNGRLQEEDVMRMNRSREREGLPILEPLYTVKDAVEAMKQFKPVPYGKEFEIFPGMKIILRDAGHILGSASVEMTWTVLADADEGRISPILRTPSWHPDGFQVKRLIRSNEAAWRKPSERKIVFSGDIGRENSPVIRDPTSYSQADYVLTESTYGNRAHSSRDHESLAEIVIDAVGNGGKVLIPAFSVGRTQDLLYILNDLVNQHKIPTIPVFVDSPLAIKATEIYRRHSECFDAETLDHIMKKDDPFDFPLLKLTRDSMESREINGVRGPAIIIAGSGMCEGGRILHHIKHNIWKESTKMVFVGYQGEGTVGRRIMDGEKYVDIMEERCKIAAHVDMLSSFSAHADSDGLKKWIASFKTSPDIFLVHGEEDALAGFSRALEGMSFSSRIPSIGETYSLN